jgi:hypothetical protein
LNSPPSPLNSGNTQKSKWVPIIFSRKNLKNNKGQNTSDIKVGISTLKPRMRQQMQPAVLLEVSKLLEDKISLSAWNGKVLVDICVILPFLLAGTSCAGWVHIPREHSTPPNCQRNETHIGNTCWGTCSVGRDGNVVFIFFIFESDFPDRTK